jgi:hypothetical protein
MTSSGMIRRSVLTIPYMTLADDLGKSIAKQLDAAAKTLDHWHGKHLLFVLACSVCASCLNVVCLAQRVMVWWLPDAFQKERKLSGLLVWV